MGELLLSDSGCHARALSWIRAARDPSPEERALERWLHLLVNDSEATGLLAPWSRPQPRSGELGATFAPIHRRILEEIPLLEALRKLLGLDPTTGRLARGLPRIDLPAGEVRGPALVRFWPPGAEARLFIGGPGPGPLAEVDGTLTSVAVRQNIERGLGTAWITLVRSGPLTGPGWIPVQFATTGQVLQADPPRTLVPLQSAGLFLVRFEAGKDQATVELRWKHQPRCGSLTPVMVPYPIRSQKPPHRQIEEQGISGISIGNRAAGPHATWVGWFLGRELSRVSSGDTGISILGCPGDEAIGADLARDLPRLLAPVRALGKVMLPGTLTVLLLRSGNPADRGYCRDTVVGLFLTPGVTSGVLLGHLAHELVHLAVAGRRSGWVTANPEEGLTETLARGILQRAGFAALAEARRVEMKRGRPQDPLLAGDLHRTLMLASLPRGFLYPLDMSLAVYSDLPEALALPRSEGLDRDLFDFMTEGPGRIYQLGDLQERLRTRWGIVLGHSGR